MTGRPRKQKQIFEVKDVFSRGRKSLASLGFKDLILAPFAKTMEGEVTAGNLLDYVFNVLTRDIYFARVVEDIKMPGEYYIAGSRLIPDGGTRNVPKGKVLVVRVDETLPYIDVEFVLDNKEHVYRLKESEYRWLQEKIMRLT